MKVSIKNTKKYGNILNINWDVISPAIFKYALEVELEHGKKFGTITNVTNDDLLLTAKIALAHLLEYPDYYERLQKLEEKAEKYWKNKTKPKVILK